MDEQQVMQTSLPPTTPYPQLKCCAASPRAETMESQGLLACREAQTVGFH